MWDLQRAEAVKVLTAVAGTVHAVRFSPDGRLLALAGGRPGEPGAIVLADTGTWEAVKTSPATTTGGWARRVALAKPREPLRTHRLFGKDPLASAGYLVPLVPGDYRVTLRFGDSALEVQETRDVLDIVLEGISAVEVERK